jgi:hypothetical protein
LRTLRPTALLSLAFLGLYAPRSARAQNLVTNPDFSQGQMTSGWEPSASGGAFSPYWSSSPDHTGVAASGSSTFWVLSGESALHQCVPVAPGTVYDLSAWMNAASGSDGVLELRWTWYPVANCTGAPTPGGSAGFPAADDAWHQVVASAQVAPPGSAALDLVFDAQAWMSANVDDVSVSCSPSDPNGPAVTSPGDVTTTQTLCE